MPNIIEKELKEFAGSSHNRRRSQPRFSQKRENALLDEGDMPMFSNSAQANSIHDLLLKSIFLMLTKSFISVQIISVSMTFDGTR